MPIIAINSVWDHRNSKQRMKEENEEKKRDKYNRRWFILLWTSSVLPKDKFENTIN